MQVASIYAGTKGYLDDVEIPKVGDFERELHTWLEENRADLLDQIRAAKKKPELKEVDKALAEAIDKFKTVFKG